MAVGDPGYPQGEGGLLPFTAPENSGTVRVVGNTKGGRMVGGALLRNSGIGPGRNSSVARFSGFGAAGATTGASNSIVVARHFDAPFQMARVAFVNLGGAPYTVGISKVAPSPSINNNGTALTNTTVTFNKSGTAKLGDLPGADSSAIFSAPVTTFDVPASIYTNNVPTITTSDWVPCRSVACTDTGKTDLFVLQARAYVSTAMGIRSMGGAASGNTSDYNANSRRGWYGALSAGDQVTGNAAMTPVTGWQWNCFAELQVLSTSSIFNHALPGGDSTFKGQGNFDANNGGWGWSQRACEAMTDAGLGIHNLSNHALSGQVKGASIETAMNIVAQGGFATATMNGWSPNNAGSSTNSPLSLLDFFYAVDAFIDLCLAVGTKPILCTQFPDFTITSGVNSAAWDALNTFIRSRVSRGAYIADFAAVTALTSATWKTGYSLDNRHPAATAQVAIQAEWTRVVRLALDL